MKSSINSLSFLREPDLIECFSQDGQIEKIMQKRSDGKFGTGRKQLKKMLHNRGYDKQLIINATLLQNYKLDEIKEKLNEFGNYLDFNLCEGVLELHPQDTTQNSFHFHFWTNNDDKYTYDLMKHFVLTNGLALEKNVDIQGKYAKFTEVGMPLKNGQESKIVDQDLKKEMLEKNKSVLPLVERVKQIQNEKIHDEIIKQQGEIDEYTNEQRGRILKSTIRRDRKEKDRDNMQDMSRLNMVHDTRTNKMLLSANELPNLSGSKSGSKRSGIKMLTADGRDHKDATARRVDVLEALKKAKDMLHSLKDVNRYRISVKDNRSIDKQKEIDLFFGDEKDNWRSQLSEIPTTDTKSRIELLKSKLKGRQ